MINIARHVYAAFGTALLLCTALVNIVRAAETAEAQITILCANGMKSVLSELCTQLEQVAEKRVTFEFGEAGNLRKSCLLPEQLGSLKRMMRGELFCGINRVWLLPSSLAGRRALEDCR